MKETEAVLYTILEVANLLDVTTQAVYKRLQQDSEQMDSHLTSKGGKKSLTEEGVEALATLMGIEDPFATKKEAEEVVSSENALVATEAGQELMSYLKDENTRLRNELDEIKRDLKYTQELREQDRRASEAERTEASEARKRADIMLIQAMNKAEEKPRLLDRFRRRNKKEKQISTEKAYSDS